MPKVRVACFGMTLDGFSARLLYWDTSSQGRPVLDLEFNLNEDGVLRSLVAQPSGRGAPDPAATPRTSE